MIKIAIFSGSFGICRSNESASGPLIVCWNLTKALNKHMSDHINFIHHSRNLPQNKKYLEKNVIQYNESKHINKKYLDQFDVIHIISDKEIAIKIKKLNLNKKLILGTNVVFDVCNPENLSDLEYKKYEKIIKDERFIEKQIWPYVLVPSKIVLDLFKRRFNKNNKIIDFPCGVDTDLFNSKNEDLSNKTIMWIGPGEHKGESLLQPIQNILKKYNFNWILKGKNGSFSYMSNIQDFKKTNLFLSLSKFETQGLATMEAMACGLPIIWTDYQSMNNPIFKEYVYRVERNPYKIADAIIKIFTDKNLYKQFSIRSKQFIYQNYTLKHTAIKYLNLISQL